jgi:hypothetical protein
MNQNVFGLNAYSVCCISLTVLYLFKAKEKKTKVHHTLLLKPTLPTSLKGTTSRDFRTSSFIRLLGCSSSP